MRKSRIRNFRIGDLVDKTTANGGLKRIDFMVLAVLQGGPLHGYGIVQRLSELTDGQISLRPGDVYRVLYRLERNGLLASAGDADTPGGRRANYAIAETGERVLANQAELMAAVAAKVLEADGAKHVG
jgi:DNA-binding PadR family transcriptional regulator